MKNSRIAAVLYTLRHRKAFLKIEKQLLGRNTWRGRLHDIDKLFLYWIPFLSIEQVHLIHRRINLHHNEKSTLEADLLEMIIDWECARYTKPDKPLNAYQTMRKLYPEMEERIVPLLRKYLPEQLEQES